MEFQATFGWLKARIVSIIFRLTIFQKMMRKASQAAQEETFQRAALTVKANTIRREVMVPGRLWAGLEERWKFQLYRQSQFGTYREKERCGDQSKMMHHPRPGPTVKGLLSHSSVLMFETKFETLFRVSCQFK